MPKVITTKELRLRLGRHIKDLNGYMVVANETYKDRSFVVLDPDMMIGLCISAGEPQLANEVAVAIKDIGVKVSQKYRDIVGQKNKVTQLYE